MSHYYVNVVKGTVIYGWQVVLRGQTLFSIKVIEGILR